MHQSGHCAGTACTAVQLSSCSAITPRAATGGRFLLVRVLHGVRAVLDGAAERAGRDAEAFDRGQEPWALGHQIATFKMAVTAMLASAMGMRNFQAKRLQLVLTEAGIA